MPKVVLSEEVAREFSKIQQERRREKGKQDTCLA